MRLALRRPRGALAPWVDALWLFEGDLLPPTKEKVLPSGCVQILVNLHDDELRRWEGDGFDRVVRTGGSAIAGPRDSTFAIDTDEQRCITGVVFRPGGARTFLGMPIHEIAAEHPDLTNVWPHSSLRERLLEAGSDDERFEVWESTLLEHRQGLTPNPVIEFAIAAFERGRTVREVAIELGWSDKRFRQRFSDAVGLSPKRYTRVRRLQRTLHALAAKRHATLAHVAADCGYHDESHLIHEVRALTGTTPARYLPRNARDINHVVLP